MSPPPEDIYAISSGEEATSKKPFCLLRPGAGVPLCGGVCSEVFFFALCPVAVLGHCQRKLPMLALLSEARAESFSSEQLGRGAQVHRDTPRCGSPWAPPRLLEIPEPRQCEPIPQAPLERVWHGDVSGPNLVQMCLYTKRYMHISL